MYEMESFRERTLANRYQPRQSLPPQFPQVLKEYAREVLRAQPEDVLQWSATYFKRLALERDPLQAQHPPPEHYAPVVEDQEREFLLQHLIKVFAKEEEQNSNNNNNNNNNNNLGVLPVNTVKKVLLEECGLTPSQVLYIMTSSPIGENDLIDYKSFANDSVRFIQFFQQTQHEFEVSNLEDATVHGLSKRDVEQEFLRILRYVDESGTGFLPIEQYYNALLNAPYHLTDRDLRLLRIEAVRNSENEVNYEAELAYMFDRLLLAEQFFLFDEDM